MAKPTLMETLTRIAEPVVQSRGLEIWGMEVLQGARPVVRIYVDLPLAVKARLAEARSAEIPAGNSPKADTPELVTGLGSELGSELAPELATTEVLSTESVSIEQCAKISRMVGLALEVEEVFPSAYVLEVSSPGLSRVFFRPQQMLPYVGDMVEAVLLEGHPDFSGRKKFRGRLQSVTDDRFTLLVEAGAEQEASLLDVTWDQVRKAARVHVFLAPEKPGKKRKQNK